MFIIFRQDVMTNRLKHVFDFQEISETSLYEVRHWHLYFYFILFKWIYIFFF